MKRYSLKKTLVNMFVNSVFFPFVLISVVVFIFYYYSAMENYSNNNRIILQSVSNHLESSFEDSERFFLQYLFDENISGFYQYLNTNDIDSSNEELFRYYTYSRKYRESVNKYLTAYNDYHKGCGFLPENKNKNKYFFLTKYGGKVICYEKENIENSEWYEKMQQMELGEIMFIPESLAEGHEDYIPSDNTVTIVQRCMNLETTKGQGLIFLEVSGNVFSDLLKNLAVPEGGILSIYFPDDTMAYTTNETEMKLLESDEVLSCKYGQKIFIGDEEYYIFQTTDEKYGFSICYFLPVLLIGNQAIKSSAVIIGVWCCFLIFALGIYLQLMKKISISGNMLLSHINQYRMNEKNENIDDLEQIEIKEFSDISNALIEMEEKISDLVQREYIVKLHQQMAEYKAIQSEINPHFFFNIMNVLLALNRIGDTKKLEQGIVNLSKMFRYTCEQGYESTISLECGFIERYLMLEKLRFEDRIRYEIEIEEELKNFVIPKLLLQPIVENAMKHGLPNDGSCMEIQIHVHTLKNKNGKNFIWISIANDGVPYTEEVYQPMGVGIVSVKERLHISYPQSFFWYSREGRFQTICNMLILI